MCPQLLDKQYQPTKQIDKNLIAIIFKEHWKYLSNKERLNFLTQFLEEIIIVNIDVDRLNGLSEIMEVKFYENYEARAF
jgi:hypothetical protein